MKVGSPKLGMSELRRDISPTAWSNSSGLDLSRGFVFPWLQKARKRPCRGMKTKSLEQVAAGGTEIGCRARVAKELAADGNWSTIASQSGQPVLRGVGLAIGCDPCESF